MVIIIESAYFKLMTTVIVKNNVNKICEKKNNDKSLEKIKKGTGKMNNSEYAKCIYKIPKINCNCKNLHILGRPEYQSTRVPE